MIDFHRLLQTLRNQAVDFIIIGGVAAVVHGSSRVTQDLDIVYSRDPENLRRLVKALADQSPYLRGVPPGLPFQWSFDTLLMGMNFMLQTKIGAIDLLGEIAGAGNYENLKDRAFEIDVFGTNCHCLDLPTLIQTKRAAGRPKDLEAIAELENLLDFDRE